MALVHFGVFAYSEAYNDPTTQCRALSAMLEEGGCTDGGGCLIIEDGLDPMLVVSREVLIAEGSQVITQSLGHCLMSQSRKKAIWNLVNSWSVASVQPPMSSIQT